jgi:lipoprotein-anchoring transpeptidase ErfK/SrfK
MKKTYILILIATLFFQTSLIWAEEASDTTTDEPVSAALETPQLGSATTSLSDSSAAPLASVSEEATSEPPKTAVAPEAPTVSKTVAAADSVKHTVATQTSSGDSDSLNTTAMQERWKAIFSKEITPGSISYVVKPGDSLYVLARKNHTTVDLIKKINGLKGDNIYPKMKLKIYTAPLSIEIDKSKNVLVLYADGKAVKKYSVATGKNNCTPVGEFKITDKLMNPTWFKTGAILPPGSPENALGTRWMGFDKPAYGIHGTIEPKSIGTQASEGCVRMLNEEVEELYSLVPPGTKVTIQD